jgi:hypothetical protein
MFIQICKFRIRIFDELLSHQFCGVGSCCICMAEMEWVYLCVWVCVGEIKRLCVCVCVCVCVYGIKRLSVCVCVCGIWDQEEITFESLASTAATFQTNVKHAYQKHLLKLNQLLMVFILHEQFTSDFKLTNMS